MEVPLGPSGKQPVGRVREFEVWALRCGYSLALNACGTPASLSLGVLSYRQNRGPCLAQCQEHITASSWMKQRGKPAEVWEEVPVPAWGISMASGPKHCPAHGSPQEGAWGRPKGLMNLQG